MNDTSLMQSVLALARKGEGYTSPNPLVGCIIVKDGKIIGEGFHHKYGDKHAEAEAIDNAVASVAGATLYCNLEPCCHTIPEKKTPPCTERIIDEKISRVVIAIKDPNPFVNGKGIDILRKNNIQVDCGILSRAGTFFNERYIKYIKTGEPFIHLKLAQSLDGRIATANGNSKWISNKNARKFVHQLRAKYDAVLIGSKTVQKDNPSLTVRDVPGRNPYRIILDENLVIPEGSNLISDKYRDRTIIFTALDPNHQRVLELLAREIQVISLPKNEMGHLSIPAVLNRLSELKIASVLIEGGGEIFTSFVKEKKFDKISFFIAPIIIGKGINGIGNLEINSISEAFRLEQVRIKSIDNQALVEGYRDIKSLFSNGELA